MRRHLIAAAVLVLFLAGIAPAPAAAQPATPSGPPGSVTIGLAEFNDLLDRIARQPPGPVQAPVSSIVSRAEAVLRIDAGLARGTITLQGEVLRTAPTAVRLLSGGTVLDARLEGRTVALVHDNGAHAALLPGRGPFTIVVSWASPVESEPGRAGVVLPVIVAGSVRATIDAPGEGTDLRVDPAFLTRRTLADGRATIEATLASGAQARVTWSSREPLPSAAPRALRLLSDVKSLVTAAEHEIRVASLFDVTVVQGTAPGLRLHLPDGFDVQSVSGASVELAAEESGLVHLSFTPGDRRRHQFLVTMARGNPDASARTAVALPWLEGSQRETGEVGVEGVGALELTLEDQPALTRIDVAEVGPAILGLAREPLLAACRYHRRTPGPVTVGFGTTRFPDAPVLTAVADRAVATTLLTHEGRALTEVTLTVRNQAQPFLKVGLPDGATLLSAEVAGAPVKPAHGTDGTRVPLLGPGVQTREAYVVSFVYLHTGTPLARKGLAELPLARVDVPVAWLEWEVFLPERLEVKGFTGTAFDRALVDRFSGAAVDRETLAGQIAETVIVAAETGRKEIDRPRQASEPSANVQNLQRRAAGILPVRMDVPRAGRSHTFVRPLVIDEETAVAFKYKRR